MGPKKIRITFGNDQVQELLDIISEDPDHFEKPTAQIFYKKIIENANLLQGFEWTALRDKMRQQRIKYKSAIDWRNGTGAGIIGEGKEQTVREYILKLCPNFDSLDIIFGGRLSIHPLFLSGTDLIKAEVVIDYCESTEGSGQLSEGTPDSMEEVEGEDIDKTPKPPPVQEDGRSRGASPPSIKEQLQRKPGGKIGEGTSSIAQLAQMNKELMWMMERRLEFDKGLGEKRIDLELQQFRWKMEKEKKTLELEEKKFMQERELKMKEIEEDTRIREKRIEEDTRIREKKIEEETKLKMEEMRQNFELEKMKIEKGIPL